MTVEAGSFPLSRAQERMLLIEELLAGAADSMFVHAYRWNAQIEPRRMAAAVAAALVRHPVLRTVLDWDGSEPVQRVLPVPDALPVIEIRDVAATARPPGDYVNGHRSEVEVVGEACRDWWDEPFDMSRPLLRVRVLRWDDRHLLCLCVHHLVSDGWSARLLAADIRRAYRHGASALPAPGPSYLDYVRWEGAQLAGWAADDLPFWRAMLAPVGSRLAKAIDATSEAARSDYAEPLSPAATEAFLGRPRRTRLALLIRLASEALARAFDVRGRLYLGTISSGRFDPRFRSTVGPFVNPVTIPVDLDPPGDEPGDDRLAVMARRLDQCLAHARTPFDEVVRAVGGPAPAAPFSVMVSLHDWSPTIGGSPATDASAIRPAAPRTSASLMLDVVVEPDRTAVVCGRWRSGSVDDQLVRRVISQLTAALHDVLVRR